MVYKRSKYQTPFWLVYGQEAVVPLHFRQQTPIIVEILHIDVEEYRKEWVIQFAKLEEHRLIAIQHQEIQKQQQKSWHDRNIKDKNISVGGLALLYNSRLKGRPKKLQT